MHLAADAHDQPPQPHVSHTTHKHTHTYTQDKEKERELEEQEDMEDEVLVAGDREAEDAPLLRQRGQ